MVSPPYIKDMYGSFNDFAVQGHMTEHVRTVHEGKKRIYKEVNCQHCGKTFRRKWGLNIHISSAHADLVSSLVK